MSSRKRKRGGGKSRTKRQKYVDEEPEPAPAAASTAAPGPSSSAAQDEQQMLGGVRDLYKIIASYHTQTAYVLHVAGCRTRSFSNPKVAYALGIVSVLDNLYTREIPFDLQGKGQGYIRVCLARFEAAIQASVGIQTKKRLYVDLFKQLTDPLATQEELKVWFKELAVSADTSCVIEEIDVETSFSDAEFADFFDLRCCHSRHYT